MRRQNQSQIVGYGCCRGRCWNHDGTFRRAKQPMIDDAPMLEAALTRKRYGPPREFTDLCGLEQNIYAKLASAIDVVVDRSFITDQNGCYEIGEPLCLPNVR
jgi:hypothetical protein